MWRRIAALVALLAVVLPASASAARELMPGVTYARKVTSVRGRQVVVHVVTAPKPGGLYRLAPVLGDGAVTGAERVSTMQRRLSATATTVGVNGDFGNNRQGYPSGIVLRDGVLHARPSSNRASLGIGLDGMLRLARVGFFGTWDIGEDGRQALAQFNRPLEGAGVGLFTRSWGGRTPTGRNVLDVVVSGVPTAAPNVDLGGQVVSVRPGGGTSIPADGAVLQARGAWRQQVAGAAAGMPFVAKLILKPWWDQVADAIGGGPAIVRQGRISLPTTEQFSSYQLLPRHPRTAVGQLGNGRIVLVAVDGRSSRSAGMTMRDLAKALVDLGVVTGMALDGGGSTTLAFDGDVLNTPSDGFERAVTNSLMVLYFGAYAAPPAASVVSPNGDGVAEGQRLSYKLVRPSTVDVRLVGPGGGRPIEQTGQREPGTYRFEPDAKGLAEGRWRWLIDAVDGDGNSSKAGREFWVNNTLGFLELSKRHVKRGAPLGVEFTLDHDARVGVTVERAAGGVVRTLLSEARKQGEVGLTWNGRTGAGARAAPGRYLVRVRARNRLGPVELLETFTVGAAKA
jgi:hypothetical protein